MPLRKGQRIPNRTPQSHRTRKDGLELYIQQQLILDIEAFGKTLTAAQIAAKRPSLYGESGTKLNKAVRNKHFYYLTLKQNNPKEYW